MPDAWELSHGLTEPNDDADGDGLSNYHEFLAGTEPRDKNDALRIASVVRTVQSQQLNVVLSFYARSNKTYSITRRVLPSENWSALWHVTAQPTNRFLRFTNNVAPTETGAFFRLTTPRVP